MVDLRPLLFINLLFAMVLVTAGFARLNQSNENAPGTDIPPVWSEADTPSPQLPDVATQAQPETAVTDESTALKTTPAQVDNTPDTQADESPLFADETPEDSPSAMETDSLAVIETIEPPKPLPKESKPVITGKVVVKSNVYDDVVLINGKPYGSTRLELDLTPGSYQIEVAKSGYSSWNSTVDVRRGSSQTLNARLEHYTTVNYVNGEWENNVKTGEGSYREDGQLEYKGSFVNGKFHGIGTVRYATGTKYQGEWFEGKMKGSGTLTTAEGDTYVGEMNDNKFNGDGTLTKANGDIYTGYWIDGVLNGQGTLTTKDGLLYVGGFADNLFHGSGSLTYPEGGHYEGSFSNGLFHGKGVEVYPDGKKYVGQFIEGLYHGKGEILNPNGSKIAGTFKDGKPFGKATLTTAEGEVFTARSSEPGVCYRLKSYRATECPDLEGW